MITLLAIGRPTPDMPLPGGFAWSEPGDRQRPDALVVLDAAAYAAARIPAIWQSALPLVSCDPNLSQACDVSAKVPQALAGALARIKDLLIRTSSLAWDRIDGTMPGLLPFLLIRNRELRPVAVPQDPRILLYPEQARIADVVSQAECLAGLDLLSRRKPEMINDCPRCGSARLLVRDVCAVCGSSDLSEESILHHFDCAYQGLQTSFHSGDGLQCPKCDRPLVALGKDHERSATIAHCRICNSLDQFPETGFRCIDCDKSGPAHLLVPRRVFVYSLTERAYRLGNSHSDHEPLRSEALSPC